MAAVSVAGARRLGVHGLVEAGLGPGHAQLGCGHVLGGQLDALGVASPPPGRLGPLQSALGQAMRHHGRGQGVGRPGRVGCEGRRGGRGANRGGQHIQQPAALTGELGSRPQRQCGGLGPAQQGGRGGVVLAGLTGALGPEGPRRGRAAGDGHRRPPDPEDGHLAHGRVPHPAVLAAVGAGAEAGDQGGIGADPGPGGDGPQLVDQGPAGPVGLGCGRTRGHGRQLAQAVGTPQAGHLGGVGVDLGGQLLGLLGLEAGGDLGQDGGGGLQPGQVQVLVAPRRAGHGGAGRRAWRRCAPGSGPRRRRPAWPPRWPGPGRPHTSRPGPRRW